MKLKLFVVYAASLLLAALCAWLFGGALAEAYPDGILVYEPEEFAPPAPSDAFHMGMAMGWFFACLILAVAAFTAYCFNRLQTGPLQQLPLPMVLAALTCLPPLYIALQLAG